MICIPYIAGFFDGEGSVGAYRDGRGRYHLRTQLTQNVCDRSTELLGELQTRWGGNLTVQTTTHGTKYNWQLNSVTAAAFLREIVPFLIMKKDQADLAIAWISGRSVASRNDRGHFISVSREIDGEVAQALKTLKKAGMASDDLTDLVARCEAE